MSKENNYCYECEYFIKYYQEILCGFQFSGYGICSIKNKKVEEESCCNVFCKKLRKPVTERDINSAINETKQLLELLNGLKERL